MRRSQRALGPAAPFGLNPTPAPPRTDLLQVHALQQRLSMVSPASPLLALQEAADILQEHLGVDLVA